MADKKISELLLASAVTGAESLPIVQAGNTVRTTIGTLLALGSVLNLKTFAATNAQATVLGNGVLKPLSGYYSTLAAAQIDYPQVTALTEQLDWAVAAKAVETAKISGTTGARPILFPNGKYMWGAKGVTLDTNVILMSAGGMPGWSGVVAPVTIETADGATAVDTLTTQIKGCGVIGIEFSGGTTSRHAVRFRNVYYGTIERVFVSGFTHQGVLVEGGWGCELDRVNTQNCLLSPGTLTTYMGALDVSGTDHWATRCEIASYAGGTTGPLSASFYYVAIRWNASNSALSGMIAETSDYGWAVTGNNNRFTVSRGDRNWAGDWIITGSQNRFSSCDGLNSAKAATNTYDAWSITGHNNAFGECGVDSTGANSYRTAFADSSGATLFQRNVYSSTCRRNPDKCQTLFTAVNANISGVIEVAPLPFHPAANGTLPDISGTSLIILDNYNAATTITGFLGQAPGQDLYIIAKNANVTLAHNARAGIGSGMHLNGAVNKVLETNKMYHLKAYNTEWYEVA